MADVTISQALADEIEAIRKSMEKWSGDILPVTTETTVKTILQWYYLAIHYPISQWTPAVKGDIPELMEMKFFIYYGRYAKDEDELKAFVSKLKAKGDKKSS